MWGHDLMLDPGWLSLLQICCCWLQVSGWLSVCRNFAFGWGPSSSSWSLQKITTPAGFFSGCYSICLGLALGSINAGEKSLAVASSPMEQPLGELARRDVQPVVAKEGSIVRPCSCRILPFFHFGKLIWGSSTSTQSQHSCCQSCLSMEEVLHFRHNFFSKKFEIRTFNVWSKLVWY